MQHGVESEVRTRLQIHGIAAPRNISFPVFHADLRSIELERVEPNADRCLFLHAFFKRSIQFFTHQPACIFYEIFGQIHGHLS